MMTAMMETREEDKAAAETEQRDGDYLLSLFVSPLGATLSIEVEQKIDGRRWRGDFTARYIEDITQRAGNVKSFSNFVISSKCCALPPVPLRNAPNHCMWTSSLTKTSRR